MKGWNDASIDVSKDTNMENDDILEYTTLTRTHVDTIYKGGQKRRKFRPAWKLVPFDEPDCAKFVANDENK